MPAPALTPLPAAPSRASPANFASRADAFLGALPTFVSQLNALITYWNQELDTNLFMRRTGGEFSGQVRMMNGLRVEGGGMFCAGNIQLGGDSQIQTVGYSTSSTTNSGFRLVAGTMSAALIIQNHGQAVPGETSLYVYLGNVPRFRVRNDGNTYNFNNSYGGLSDERLKENVRDVSSQLSDLLALRVVNYNFIADAEKRRQVGLIAQEVQTIKPGLVEEQEDGYLNLKYSVLVPLLLKGLQELAQQVGEVGQFLWAGDGLVHYGDLVNGQDLRMIDPANDGLHGPNLPGYWICQGGARTGQATVFRRARR